MCPALKISGVYLVTCGRGDALPVYYVGQTRDFARRTKEHLYALRHGKHSNRRLQNTYNAYGVVSIEMLEPCATDELNDAEQWWIDEMHGHRRVANAAVEARSNRGYKKTDAARRAQSERQRGQNNPMFGKPWSTERRAERRASTVGAQNHFYGRAHTDAAKAKMSANAAGRRPEVKAKIAAALQGRQAPPEVIAKLRACHQTKPVTCVSPDGCVTTFNSLADAGRAGFHKAHVAECCNGRRKSHRGFTWSWANDCLQKKEGFAAARP